LSGFKNEMCKVSLFEKLILLQINSFELFLEVI